MGLRELIKKNTNPDELRANFARLAVSVESAINPNHRHDEKWEQAIDAQREEICASHRFRSFAPDRTGNHARWYSDGADYFWALSEILDRATSHIFILDWWLSPELYLRRPPHLFEEFRMDRILKRKAEQGVRIFIVVYKEVTQTMTMSSAWTKHYLEDLHPNIVVVRHPDHLGGEITLMWSHHEKLVVVDNTWACVGGLDICYGRWDTHNHPLSDVHPTDWNKTLFVGQDYNNARIEDFQNVNQYMSNNQSRTVVGRMPWHDVHTMLFGPAVLDVAMHFIERWNFLKEFKYKADKRLPWLAFPNGAERPEDVDPQYADVARHPHMQKLAQIGQQFRHPFHSDHRVQRLGPDMPMPAEGSAKIQVLRSSADWSLGILTEHSIQNAYVEMISEAEHFIYIENQFFITSTDETGKDTVKNQIGTALVKRIIRAHEERKKFKVIIVIPTIPCFAGELDKAAGIRVILGYQYRSISSGPDSIFGRLRSAGVTPDDYISFYHLRGYDRINFPKGLIKEIERRSGVTYQQTQVALARVYTGDEAQDVGLDANGNLKGPLHASYVKLYDPEAPVPKDIKAPAFSGTPKTIQAIPIPRTVAEAEEILYRFQEVARQLMDPSVRDSVASDILISEPHLASEPWQTDPVEEIGMFVTEETYIHSKLMIVDDRRVLCGSANLNDRSQMGNRDSEIAVVIEDQDMFDSVMDGQPYRASKYAASFRRFLFRQHLGLIPPQEITPETARSFPTPGMQPAPAASPDPSSQHAREDPHEQLVVDPLSDEFENTWKTIATTNTKAYDDVFHPVPSDRVANWKAYNTWFPTIPIVTGHVADLHADPNWVRQRLSDVKGSLVNFAHHFMSDEDLVKGAMGSAEVNDVTLPIYL